MRVEKKRLTTIQQPNHSKNFGVRLRKFALKPDHSQQVILNYNIRRVEDFIAGSERPYFVLNRTPYGAEPGTTIPELISPADSREGSIPIEDIRSWLEEVKSGGLKEPLDADSPGGEKLV
jgi:hypothetical protein